MAHDVFISYSRNDKPTADAVTATLETQGIRCWIAPRDVLPGTDWGAAIVEAIHESQIMIIVFSERANQSRHIKREVERAVSRGVIVLPFRIEDIAPSPSLEYFIGSIHWLDALSPPMEQHLQGLAEKVRVLLSKLVPDRGMVAGGPPSPEVDAVLKRAAQPEQRPRTPPQPDPTSEPVGGQGGPSVAAQAVAVAKFCTRCGTANTAAMPACQKCGTDLRTGNKACGRCGSRSAAGMRFCTHCGAAI